jgi:hypothetical protein
MFSKRHYEWLAQWISNELPDACTEAERVLVARHLALELEKHNPNFNRERFLKACNIGEKKIAETVWV